MNTEPTAAPMTAARLMNDRAPALRTKDSVLEAVELAVRDALEHIAVVDKEGHAIGVVEDAALREAFGDLRQALGRRRRRRDMGKLQVRELMSQRPVVVGLDTTVPQLAEAMLGSQVRAALVVDGNQRLLGVVSYLDLLRHVAALSTRAGA